MPKSGASREKRFRTRAEIQDEVRQRAQSLALRQHVVDKMQRLREASDDLTVDHLDLQRCLESGTVTDVGADSDGTLATVLGSGIDVSDLVVVVYVTHAYRQPLYVEDFIVGRR